MESPQAVHKYPLDEVQEVYRQGVKINDKRIGVKDDLLGMKENIIIGHLIPAGTGQYRYQEVEIEGMEMPVMEEPLPGSHDPLPGVYSQPFAETGFSLGGSDD